MGYFFFIFLILKSFGIPDVSSRYLLIKVQDQINHKSQSEVIPYNDRYASENTTFYNTGYDLAEDYDVAGNESILEDGNDLAEVGGCRCNCKGECEPKGCQGLKGKKLQSRTIGGFKCPILNYQ